MIPQSSVRDIVWPAIVKGEASTLLAAAFQLEQSQWWSPEEILAHQLRQLAGLLRHAHATVPLHRRRLAEAGITGDRAITPQAWRRIPILSKQEIRQHHADLRSRRVPADHGGIHRYRTSGSTGDPLEILGTEVNGFVWQALSLRDVLWHQRDLGGRLVAIRSGRYERDPLAVRDLPSWGLISPGLYRSGPMTLLYHLTPIPRQAAILKERDPHYLLTYPSNARDLARHAREVPLRLSSLRAVHTYGEPLTPDVRAASQEVWGVPVHDVYSCEEVGYIALQCPWHDHYHVQSESVLVEVLDDEGNPARPGEIGRVVITSLHNFAMPILRYAIGDYAEVGGPCPCGRGLPVLTRILGRRRNQVSLPDGRRAWPDIGAIWTAIPGAKQIQVVQRGDDDIEVRFARAAALRPEQEMESRSVIQRALGSPFRLTFIARDAISRQRNGKYETFFDERV